MAKERPVNYEEYCWGVKEASMFFGASLSDVRTLARYGVLPGWDISRGKKGHKWLFVPADVMRVSAELGGECVPGIDPENLAKTTIIEAYHLEFRRE